MNERTCPGCQQLLPPGSDECGNCAERSAARSDGGDIRMSRRPRRLIRYWLLGISLALTVLASALYYLTLNTASRWNGVTGPVDWLRFALNSGSTPGPPAISGTLALGADSDHGVPVDFGTVDIGGHVTTAVSVTVLTAGVLGSISVVTQGVPDLDFNNAGSGTCTVGASYPANSTCTVNVSFSPKGVGTRLGAVVLQDASGEAMASRHIPMATGYLMGTGNGTWRLQSEAPPLRIGTGWVLPWGFDMDAAGNIFVANYPTRPYDAGGSVIKESPAPGGYIQTTIGSGFVGPSGIAVDGAGNVYISDASLQVIFRETPYKDGYVQSQIPTPGIGWPTAVAVDGGGNVYLTDAPKNRILKESLFAGTYRQTSIPTSVPYPLGLAVDPAGNIYVANGDLVKETPNGETYLESKITSGYEGWNGWGAELTIDAVGNLLIADTKRNQIVMLPLAGSSFGKPILLLSVSRPMAVASAVSGDLFYTTGAPGAAGFWRAPLNVH